ncbi:MAG: patatin-like phospholipase family protein, partial [Cyclobacteriaceae bacterium]
THIALCLSGGGYRAASYSLGTMSYLDHLRYKGTSLLENVVTISTVSGGTIPGIRYALDQSEGRPFEETYTFLRKLLPDTDMIKLGLIELDDPKNWQDGLKRRNLINGAARVYQKMLFDDRRLATLQDSSKDMHLKNMLFNATEFDHGIAFRFLVSEKDMRFGNGLVYSKDDIKGTGKLLSDEDTAGIRLGDIMAASSCFPGGFEPMAFPDDFVQDKNSPLARRINQSRRNDVDKLQKELSKESNPNRKARLKYEVEQESDFFNPPTGLMDGGIYDNQGTGSVLTLERNYGDKPYHQLMIVSDVASYFVDDYAFDKNPSKGFWSGFSYDSAKTTLITLVAVLLAGTLLFAFLGEVVPATIAGTLFVSIGSISYLLFNRLNTLRGGLPSFATGYLKYFRSLRWGLMRRLIKDRLNSVMLMTTTIFLKGIRSLHQTILYQDPQWEDRRVYSEIYYLQEKIRSGKIVDEKGRLTTVANQSRLMPTTLWFTKEENDMRMIDTLIACGQATLCIKLIQYVDELLEKNPYYSPVDDEMDSEGLKTGTAHEHLMDDTMLSEEEKSSLEQLKKTLEADWQKFLDAPLWLAEQYYKETP